MKLDPNDWMSQRRHRFKIGIKGLVMDFRKHLKSYSLDFWGYFEGEQESLIAWLNVSCQLPKATCQSS